ncbi:NAD-dependent epimerase/dehydratase family protein [Sediminispirochaeta smaragdinae]|uniref:NAD-dependent epimerase/dehydratase n=1 Tax=Sediminispirochaeta smaragdinae (strain DSM 11293 / JCM 15392 / SEBR 4228) TaxID=573413 RepID=E1RA66_SEDSS|nr:NAD-dependent epimerase/dehydratase family protein [Sediminispirochaeta smaragdinae]ADK79357.1 NAD-dependent epimerase/dehydratase [Sediminispirochaeta smaragdinae DSM 11293]
MSYLKRERLPEYIESEEELDDLMSLPSKQLIDFQKNLEGDLIILGVGGKIGVQLALAAKKASIAAAVPRRIIGVSRFSNPEKRTQLEEKGIETISCDLSDPVAVKQLPDAKNVVFMVGRKFGTCGSEEETWAMNTLVPDYVSRRYANSAIVVYSTGNVYGLVPVNCGGSIEADTLHPQGEYAISALGRERIFQYYSKKNETPISILRLNYAIDLRYGVLREIGEKVKNQEVIDLSMGNVNVIWQGDVINQTLLSFAHCTSPANIINITGPETVSIRYVAGRFSRLFNKPLRLEGEESGTALLNNASYAASLFGYPHVSLLTMVKWIAHWLEIGGTSLDKPTHFASRNGIF